jgi:hypothetical protein
MVRLQSYPDEYSPVQTIVNGDMLKFQIKSCQHRFAADSSNDSKTKYEDAVG